MEYKFKPYDPESWTPVIAVVIAMGLGSLVAQVIIYFWRLP